MANYLEFTPNVSWAKVRVGYEESYDTAAKANILTITSIEVMSTQYTAEYYVDGVLNVNGEAILTFKSSTGNVMVAVNATNTWYSIKKDGSPVTATVQIEGSETATIELTGNNFLRFAFYTVDEKDGNGWGVSESKEIALMVKKWDEYSFWLGVALGLAGKGLPPMRTPTAYLYNGVQLPPLPEWDRDESPYYCIVQGTGMSAGIISLYKSINPIIYSQANGALRYGQLSYRSYLDNKGAWSGSFSHLNNPKNDTYIPVQIIWAGTDILNEDGTVYFAASEPIPVYE